MNISTIKLSISKSLLSNLYQASVKMSGIKADYSFSCRVQLRFVVQVQQSSDTKQVLWSTTCRGELRTDKPFLILILLP